MYLYIFIYTYTYVYICIHIYVYMHFALFCLSIHILICSFVHLSIGFPALPLLLLLLDRETRNILEESEGKSNLSPAICSQNLCRIGCPEPLCTGHRRGQTQEAWCSAHRTSSLQAPFRRSGDSELLEFSRTYSFIVLVHEKHTGSAQSSASPGCERNTRNAQWLRPLFNVLAQFNAG